MNRIDFKMWYKDKYDGDNPLDDRTLDRWFDRGLHDVFRLSFSHHFPYPFNEINPDDWEYSDLRSLLLYCKRHYIPYTKIDFGDGSICKSGFLRYYLNGTITLEKFKAIMDLKIIRPLVPDGILINIVNTVDYLPMLGKKGLSDGNDNVSCTKCFDNYN